MRASDFLLIASGVLSITMAASATTRYVNLKNAAPVVPYISWATAATTIQAAVDVAVAGDQIVVTNGTYASGGRAVYGTMTNRVAIDKAVTVRSVNGPLVTIIEGRAAPGSTNGDGAIRCVYVRANAVLSGFTLTNGHTQASGGFYEERSGGGAWCEVSGVVTNCTLRGNSANFYGGGAYSGTLNNCTLNANSAFIGGGASSSTLNNSILSGNSANSDGGGVSFGTLNNCTLSRNSASGCAGGAYCATLYNCTLGGNSANSDGGGAYGGTLNNCILNGNSAFGGGGGAYSGTLNNCTLSGNSARYFGGGANIGTLNNCIVYYNFAINGSNYFSSTLNYCCTTPLPPGPGNIDTEPLLASTSHLSEQSPCIGRGSSAYIRGLDIDGEQWLNPPCIGADQFVRGQATGALSLAIDATYTNVAAGFLVSFVALNEGRISGSVWDFGDGTVVSNRVYASHAWAAPGLYTVRLTGYNDSRSSGVSTTVRVRVDARKVYYVNAASTTPVYPYANWAGAAANIQDAINAGTQIGRQVLVADGVYKTGGRAVCGTMTNRVIVAEGVEVRSVNGPLVTIIEGQPAPGATNGDGAIRCAYVGRSAGLSGFTLTNGHTRAAGISCKERNGGGAWCEVSGTLNNCTLSGNSANSDGGGASFGTLNNCALSRNSASRYGGGAYSALLNNCTLAENSADQGGGVSCGMLNNCTLSRNSADQYGGGAYSGTLNNCTLSRNLASLGGGAYSATLNNCIVYYNSALNGQNYGYSTLNYCCATPLASGPGNIDVEPLLASTSHLSEQSPCIGRGSSAYTSGVDIDGEQWLDPPCIGADQSVQGQATGALALAIDATYTNIAVGFPVSFTALNEGRISASVWDLGDGTVVSNRAYASRAWAAPGLYTVRLTGYNDSWPGGVSTAVRVRVDARKVYYVNAGNTAPVYPYTNWAGAAANIQDAIDAGTQPGRLVLVADGVYKTGGRAAYGTMTNRVVVTEGVELRSVNGPLVTIIEGQPAPGSTNGNGAIRCAYVGINAVLSGFTLTNGHTRAAGNSYKEQNGGGARCEVSGTLNNCTLSGNSASYGGGAYYGTLTNCALSGNSANSGGGAYFGTLNNCTLSGNSATNGGGAHSATLKNCIVYYNLAPNGSNYYGSDSRFSYCCTTPLPPGRGNIEGPPGFVDTNGWSNLRLQTNSPCINAGADSYVSTSTDLDGSPRIVGGTVDTGAYEFQSPASAISYAWLQQYGLSTDGLADLADLDADGFNNWQEWAAGTDPTNSTSALRMLAVPPATSTTNGITVGWTSVTNRTYCLERALVLGTAPGFGIVRSNISGLNNTTTFTDTNAAGPGPFFYRVRVEN